MLSPCLIVSIILQGFADCLILMRYSFESPEAALLNKQIFETIYYSALEVCSLVLVCIFDDSLD